MRILAVLALSLILVGLGRVPSQHTIKGRVVDKNNVGLPKVPIVIVRGAETIAASTTADGAGKAKGSYSISFTPGGTLDAVVYGNSEYGPNSVFNISGETDHEITKVLSRNQVGQVLTNEEASDVVTTLDYFRAHSDTFARQMVQYSFVLTENNVPEEYRSRLRDFQASVAKLPKTTTRPICLATDDCGVTEVVLNGKKISIDYGRRPAATNDRGFSSARIGSVWSLGAAQASEIEIEGTLNAGGKDVKAGRYTIWLKKNVDGNWSLAFHPRIDVWSDPLERGFIAEIPLKLQRVQDSASKLEVTLDDLKDTAAIKIHLGNYALIGSLKFK